MEHQVNDDKEHHDSDDVSGIHSLASWTSVLGKPSTDVGAGEYVISPGSVWSVTADQAAAPRLQANHMVSTMVNPPNGITRRIVSRFRPHDSAVAVDPSLEEAYLLAVGTPLVYV